MTRLTGTEKIDIFAHILPPKYAQKLGKIPQSTFLAEINSRVQGLQDLDARFRIMDRYEGIRSVLTIATPSLEMIADPATSIQLARIANDELAELVNRYPDRFAAGVACLPMNDIDAALNEIDRAIKELNLKGIQLYTPLNGKPLDSPELMPVYAKMCEYDLPIWVHPTKDKVSAEYVGEKQSKYGLFLSVGWPFETTLMMCRLVFSGILEKYPNLKIITHHCGGMLPYFANRVALQPREWLKKLPLEYFKLFYGDTATVTNVPALMCGHAFFGGEHMLFGTDMPYTSLDTIDLTIEAVEQMAITDAEKEKIFHTNARRLLRLGD